MPKNPLLRVVLIIVLFFGVIAGLYYAKPFLVPLTFAAILSMLLLPLTKYFKRRGMGRAMSVLVPIVLLILVLGGLISLLVWQVTDLASDFTNMEGRVKEMASQLQNFIAENFGIEKTKQEEVVKKSSQGGGQASGIGASIVSGVMSFLVDFVLVFVYMFLLLYMRGHLKKFILKFVPESEQENANITIRKAVEVGQKYITGLGMMIGILWILYGIGFSVVGLRNALFFAVLCGLLEIIPFIGNLTGTALALLMAVSQGGGSSVIVGILITYGLVQFIQTYIIEPLVVGAEVNINPLFTILVLVAGEAIWGIPGMVLAIPILGVAKVIFDHIPALQPYGFLIGEEKKKKKESGLMKKVKSIFKKK